MRKSVEKNSKHREVSSPSKVLRGQEKECPAMCDNKLQKVHVMLTAIDVVEGEVDIPNRINSYKNPDSSTEYLTLINIHLV